MKKIFLILTIVFVGCEPQNTPTKQVLRQSDLGFVMEEITYEECQYIGHFSGHQSNWGTHKGTCNNPIHDVQSK